MPQQRPLLDLIPISDSRQRCVDHHPFGNAGRILCHQRIAHHIADVVRYQVGLPDLQRIHHARDIHGLVLLGVACIRMRGEAHTAQVRHHYRMILREHCGCWRPHVARIAKSVQHDDRGPLTADSHMQYRTVGLDFPGMKGRRVRLQCEGGSRD